MHRRSRTKNAAHPESRRFEPRGAVATEFTRCRLPQHQFADAVRTNRSPVAPIVRSGLMRHNAARFNQNFCNAQKVRGGSLGHRPARDLKSRLFRSFQPRSAPISDTGIPRGGKLRDIRRPHVRRFGLKRIASGNGGPGSPLHPRQSVIARSIRRHNR